MRPPSPEISDDALSSARNAVGGKGSNSAQLRHYNERVVLEAIRRRGQASKADIARHAKLTPPAVSGIVDTLVEAGYVEQKGKRFGRKGQPSVMFGLAPGGGFSLGLHLGRRTLDAVLIDFTGTVRLTESHEYDFPEPDAVRRIGGGAILRLRATLGESAERLIGIGISAPYFLGGWEEELASPAEASARWREVELTSFFPEAGNLPIFVENDASAAAAAELVYGAGIRFRDFIHLSINTMVGGGLIMDGMLQTGPNGNAAAFGPMPVTPSRLRTVPKPAGPFEILLRRASIYGLINHLRASGSGVQRVRELDPLPLEARAPFNEWQEDCADALAQAIVSAIAVIDVEAVVIDGLLPRALLQDTVAKVQRRFAAIVPSGLVLPEIVAGTVGPQASAIGASILPINALFAPDSGVLTRKAVEKKPQMIRRTS